MNFLIYLVLTFGVSFFSSSTKNIKIEGRVFMILISKSVDFYIAIKTQFYLHVNAIYLRHIHPELLIFFNRFAKFDFICALCHFMFSFSLGRETRCNTTKHHVSISVNSFYRWCILSEKHHLKHAYLNAHIVN